jgi:hypothetical protein
MTAYPEYRARVLLSIEYNAGGFLDRFGTEPPAGLGLGKSAVVCFSAARTGLKKLRM